MYIHLNGYTVNSAHITWITQNGNTLLIHILMQNMPLQIPYRSAISPRYRPRPGQSIKHKWLIYQA